MLTFRSLVTDFVFTDPERLNQIEHLLSRHRDQDVTSSLIGLDAHIRRGLHLTQQGEPWQSHRLNGLHQDCLMTESVSLTEEIENFHILRT